MMVQKMKLNPSFGKFIVTNRDLSVLAFLAESKIASRDQLKRLFFNNTKGLRMMYRRLRFLLKSEYIYRAGIEFEGRFLLCYMLTEKGFSVSKAFNRYSFLKMPERSEKPVHDLHLVDIRDALHSRTKVEQYLTENILQLTDIVQTNEFLKTFVRCNADAGIKVVINQKPYWLPLEFENSSQNDNVIYRKLKKYYQSEIKALLLICKNQQQIVQIQEIEHRLRGDFQSAPIVFYSTLDVLLNATGSISFTNLENKTIII